MSAELPPAAVARLVAHAEAEPEREVCGFVVSAPGAAEPASPAHGDRDPAAAARGAGDPEVWPVPNAARDPAVAFAVAPEVLLAVHARLAREGRRLLAIYHSHPGGTPELSPTDRAEALAGGAPLHPGAALVVLALRDGRVTAIRAHRWEGSRFAGVALPVPDRCAP